MRRTIIALIIVIAGATMTTVAQDYFTPLFSAYVDHRVNEVPPCVHSTASAVVYEQTLMVMYACVDGHPIFRRYFRANPHIAILPPEISVESPVDACPLGFVAGQLGGCVPPDHPAARK